MGLWSDYALKGERGVTLAVVAPAPANQFLTLSLHSPTACSASAVMNSVHDPFCPAAEGLSGYASQACAHSQVLHNLLLGG